VNIDLRNRWAFADIAYNTNERLIDEANLAIVFPQVFPEISGQILSKPSHSRKNDLVKKRRRLAQNINDNSDKLDF
jgi:hypothetical protein